MDVSELPKANQESRSEKSVNGFLAIFSDLFRQPGSPTLEDFGLYSKANLDTFLAGIPEQEAEYYKYLAKTIISSHNVNCLSQQTDSPQKLERSIADFQEYYNSPFFSYPPVKKALAIYENTLRKIRSENNGFVPESFVEYKGSSASNWDKTVKGFFLRSGINWQSDRTGSEADLYLTLAKAAGNASLKFAEIMNEKPGLIGRFISAIKNRLTYPLKPLEQPVKIPVN